MKIRRCPKCRKLGSLVFTYRSRRGRRKHPRVLHYDRITKGKKRCNITRGRLDELIFDTQWYFDYVTSIERLAKIMVRKVKDLRKKKISDDIELIQIYRLLGEGEIRREYANILFAKEWQNAFQILTDNGFPKEVAIDKISMDNTITMIHKEHYLP